MGRTLTNLLYHIIFSTKGREPLIIPEIRDELHRYMGGIIKGEGGVLLETGGMSYHIHLAIKLRPIHSISEIMQKLKEITSSLQDLKSCWNPKPVAEATGYMTFPLRGIENWSNLGFCVGKRCSLKH